MPVCIVAGVGPGVGAAVAAAFAKTGYDVALLARRRTELEAIAASIGPKAHPYACDVSNFDAMSAAIAAATGDLGEADVLVYNAAGWRMQPAIETPPELFLHDVSVSAAGALAAAQAVHPAMKARGRGVMLFTGGGLSLHPELGVSMASLTAGKGALRGLVHVLAKELAPDGIHVGLVTIAGNVARGTAFDPDRIAPIYLDLAAQPPGAWEVERVYRG